MPRNRRIENTVAENRRSARQLETYEVEVDQRPSRDYSFDGSVVEVNVRAEVYTRPLQSTLVFGHPDASQGFGRGTFGDRRGDWSLVESVSQTEGEFTKGGREAVADALEGAISGLDTAVVGDGTSTASTGDTALDSQQGARPAWGNKGASNETIGVGEFRFSEYGDIINEIGIEGNDGSLLTRLTTSGVDPTSSQEVRVDIIMEFVGDGVADAVITSDGEAAIADSIKTVHETVGLKEMAIGTGTADPSKSDTSLANEVGRKDCARDRQTEQVRAFIKWYKNEPSGQPYDVTEMGVFDNSATPRLVFRVTFDSFLKDSNVSPTTGASIRII